MSGPDLPDLPPDPMEDESRDVGPPVEAEAMTMTATEHAAAVAGVSKETIIARLQDQVPAGPPEAGELTAIDVKNQVGLIQQVMKSTMKESQPGTTDGHYGKIPGCGDKPTLFKAGAEKLSLTFKLAPRYRVTIRPIDAALIPGLAVGHREVEVTCFIYHQPTGRFLGSGVGTCSTMESKYRYRDRPRTCPSCGAAAIIKGKEEYGGGWLCWKKKDGCGNKWADGDQVIEGQESGKVENDNPADVWNTVLKIGKKRAHVDAVLTVTAASDIFTQDIEDLPGDGDRAQGKKPEGTNGKTPATPVTKPAPSNGGSRPPEDRVRRVPPKRPEAAQAPPPADEELPVEDVPGFPIFHMNRLEEWGEKLVARWGEMGYNDVAIGKAVHDANGVFVYCRNCKGPCWKQDRGLDEFACMGKSKTDYCPELDAQGVQKGPDDKPYRLGWKKGKEPRSGEWYSRKDGGSPYRTPAPASA